MVSCRIVAKLDNVAPETASAINAGISFDRCPMVLITAILEINPDIRPTSGKPMRAPNHRKTRWPRALMAITNITMIQRLRGLIASNGPINSLGTSGKIMSVAAAKIRKSFSSSFVTLLSTNRWIGSLAASKIAIATAIAADNEGEFMARPPKMTVIVNAISVVIPGS